MQIKHPVLLKAVSLSFMIAISIALSLPGAAQVKDAKKADEVPSPAEEIFSETDAVASPYVSGYPPNDNGHPYRGTDGHKVTGADIFKLDKRIIYNEDGSVWYSYKDRMTPMGPDRHYREDFWPFAGEGDFGKMGILKMFAESDHWYKVEVNAKTHATKFILKSDPNWEKTSWDFWLAKTQVFGVPEGDKTEIRDKPNGKVIALAPEITSLRYLAKRDGDWMYVDVSITGRYWGTGMQGYGGWVRWREGQDMLLRSYPGKIAHVTIHLVPAADRESESTAARVERKHN
jgi:hypothetical protein